MLVQCLALYLRVWLYIKTGSGNKFRELMNNFYVYSEYENQWRAEAAALLKYCICT